ncbi:MAG: CHAT domain-containing protein [Spirulina sp. SIO3F2]|nr:CHAT domain-containing protein [Spirulina sp. SIO3F2]
MLKTWLQMGSFLILPFTLTAPTFAQSITAAPDGTSTVVNYNGHTYHIQGGTQAGANLFHSFQALGLSSGEIADFLSNPTITNIFGRVTGGDPSIIDGLIQVTGANSNLYLMNPAGIVFGQGASLNVGGDFTATTANQIGFVGGWFNATGANDYAALVGAPNQFAFLSEQPGAILNFGDLSTENNVSLVGGTVLNQGQVVSRAGSVTLAAVPGERLVKLSQPGMLLSLELPTAVLTAEVSPVDLPELLTGAGSTTGGLPLQNLEVGDVMIAGAVSGQQADLYAAGKVTPTDADLIQGDTRVIRFSDAGGNPNQSVFIDARADNLTDLLFGAEAGTVAQIIEKDKNGIAVISEQLAAISDSIGKLDSVAIVAEGNEGNFWLGNQWIRTENISDYAAPLQGWGEALTENADLLLYSCFTALGETGEALVQQIADLTGVDVAASVNATGSVNYGGDWILEQTTGEIEAMNPFTASTLTAWDGKLAMRTVTSLLDDNSGGTLRAEIAAASAGDSITFGVVGTVILNGTEISWNTDNLTIEGNGSVVDGNYASRVFRIRADNATLQDLTIQKGSVTNNGAGIGYTGNGTLTLDNVQILNNVVARRAAGVRSTNGLVMLRNSLVSGNSARLGRGGISVDNNDLIIIDSIISENSAGTFSGGIRADNITVINSTIAKNSAGSAGGGIHNPEASGSVTLLNSIVSQNTTGTYGGGINAMGSVNVINSTVSNNSAGNHGGGIRATGAVNVIDSTITNNTTGNNGGGIHAAQTVSLNRSTVAENSAGNGGGGIHVGGAIDVTDSTIANNLASLDGGGINADDTVTLSNSTISGNLASNHGGGVYANGATRLFNSTVSSNRAAVQGGGLFVTSPVTLTNATIAANTAHSGGGGIRVSGLENNQIMNTIIANNADTSANAPEISANLSSSTVQHSLLMSNAGITGLTLTDGVNGNIIGKDPRLGPLQNNGGSTQTHALLMDSPALNKGNNTLALDANGLASSIDQIGNLRTMGGIVDVGAYERQVEMQGHELPVSISTSESQSASDFKHPLCLLTCTPNPPLISPELFRAADQLLSLGVDGVEVRITNDYATLILENDDVKPLTIAQAQTLMQDIEQQTGVRPAVLYFTFVPGSSSPAPPPHPHESPATLTHENALERVFPIGLTPFSEPRRTAKPEQTSLPVPFTQAQEPGINNINGDAQLQLILVSPEGDPIVRHPLGITRSQVAQQVREFRAGLNNIAGDRYRPASQQLYDWLIRPVQEELQALEIEHLSIVADEGLRSLPMAALHDGEGFLVENYSIGLMPSLSLIDWRYQPLHNATILAMGASEFAEQPPLPAVPIELSLIAEHPEQKYLNADFTYGNLRSQANQRQFQILHLATHAQFRKGTPDAAYIQLWGEDDVQLKGLREFKLYTDPALELLVLSACDTAVGDATTELGFAGAAVQAGVKSVLASLWQVSDLGTLALMNSFYAQLTDPDVTIKAQALRQAQLALLNGDISVQQGYLGEVALPTTLADYPNTDLRHPYYWSAFTLVGSPW